MSSDSATAAAPASVGEFLRHRAREHPDALFLVCGPDRLTFSEADERSDRVARAMCALGLGPGDRVAILSANRIEVLELFFACAKVGAVQVPFNAALRGEFLRYQLADCDPALLVVDAPGAAAVAELGAAFPADRTVLLDDMDAAPAGARSYATLRESTQSLRTPPPLGPAALMSIVYTSGTTGMPKGCMLSHGYYLTIAAAMGEAWEMAPGDVLLTSLPLFHTAARAMVLTAALVRNATCVIEPAFHPATVLERARETGATLFAGVGAMGVALLGQPPSPADRDHPLRRAVLIPFPPALQEQFEERFGVEVNAELYGQTECVPISYSPWTGERRRASAGRPAPHLEVRLVDDEDRTVKPGEVGEIVVRPRQPFAMFSGYWNRPEATVEAWRNLWHHTGDFARQDADGFLYFVDRKKDAIRRRGENVSSLQLEAVIAQHPDIAEVAVCAVPSEMTEDDIKACVVLRPGATLTPEAFREFLVSALPAYALPRYVEVVDELPKNAVLRVMKHVLRERGITPQTWDYGARDSDARDA